MNTRSAKNQTQKDQNESNMDQISTQRMETMFETLMQIMADIKETLNMHGERSIKLEQREHYPPALNQNGTLKTSRSSDEPETTHSSYPEENKVSTSPIQHDFYFFTAPEIPITQPQSSTLPDKVYLHTRNLSMGTTTRRIQRETTPAQGDNLENKFVDHYKPSAHTEWAGKRPREGIGPYQDTPATTSLTLNQMIAEVHNAAVGGLYRTSMDRNTSFSIDNRTTAVASLLVNLRFIETQTHYTNRAQFWHQSGNRPSPISQTYHSNKTEVNNHYPHYGYLEFSIPPSTRNEGTHDTLSSYKSEPLSRSPDINVQAHTVLDSTGDHNNNKSEQQEANRLCHERCRTATDILLTLPSSSSLNNYGQHCAAAREHLHCASKGLHQKMILFKTVPKNGSIFLRRYLQQEFLQHFQSQ